MKLIVPFRLILFFLFLFLMMGSVSGQCISFARNIAKPLLEDYIHDGNYNATYMEEGESAELYKTFFQDEEYRLVVSGVESLPQIHIRLLDDQRNVIFDNANHDFAQVWDFKAETTGTLIVYLKIPDSEEGTQITGGCIAILFGVESTGRRN
ncbi:hypothetical protein [Geofilum rubicundum]|uniref:Uncharacterized protein n=1 Tax=Geofilum rubicundum JCM 15548 TaxID=1236989 RepID=A0A0E9LTR6_9BACT|nr:hypothetical protein [Geofilum rubicundum]GAO28654.1 hypothetical protein JCM15548_1775 [Geofilum rubicundum JCM 15548]